MMMKNFRVGDWISKKVAKLTLAGGERGQSADAEVPETDEGQDKRRKGAQAKGQTRESRFSGRQQ